MLNQPHRDGLTQGAERIAYALQCILMAPVSGGGIAVLWGGAIMTTQIRPDPNELLETVKAIITTTTARRLAGKPFSPAGAAQSPPCRGQGPDPPAPWRQRFYLRSRRRQC